MKRIRFTKTSVFETHGPNNPNNPVYVTETEYVLRNDQADRWLRRQRAVLVEDMGPDEIEGADPLQVEEIERELQRRSEGVLDAMAGTVATARQALQAALG